MANKDFDIDVFTAMQEGDPVASYRKTVLGKVYVTVLNVFSKEPEMVQLYGQPGEPKSIISVWSIPEDIFFQRSNRRLLEKGSVIRVDLPKRADLPAPATPVSLEQSSDEVLRQLVNSRFKALEAALNKTGSEALVYRLLTLAQEEEKSEKIINAIKLRLTEIQNSQITEKPQ